MANLIQNLTEGTIKMDLDGYLTFTIASLLISIGIIFLSLTLILLNNLFNKYWKTVKIVDFIPRDIMQPTRFAEPEEVAKIKPEIDKSKEPKLKEVK
jgi:hypothetical protein